MKLSFEEAKLTEETRLIDKEKESVTLGFSSSGSGLWLPWLAGCVELYFVFYVEGMEDHSLAMEFLVYGEEETPVMTIRFGVLPQVETCICMDLDWLDGSVLFQIGRAHV